MSFFFAIETALLDNSVVDTLIRFVLIPQPANYLVACMECRLLAFNASIVGGYFFKEEVLG